MLADSLERASALDIPPWSEVVVAASRCSTWGNRVGMIDLDDVRRTGLCRFRVTEVERASDNGLNGLITKAWDEAHGERMSAMLEVEQIFFMV